MKFDFILDAQRFSYSSASTYAQCPYAFYLSYIEAKERRDNFFSDYGSFCHLILEKYFKGMIDANDMVQYYIDHYSEHVVSDAPPYPPSMEEQYYKDGIDFFTNFKFNKEDYDIVFIEDAINHNANGIDIIIKPDLVLKDRRSGIHILIDYKTSKLKNIAYGTVEIAEKDLSYYDKRKVFDYKKQFLLYVKYIWECLNIEVKEIWVWFIRNNAEVVIPVEAMEVEEANEWFLTTIEKIKAEEKWDHNTDPKNKYFCENICGVGGHCVRNLVGL